MQILFYLMLAGVTFLIMRQLFMLGRKREPRSGGRRKLKRKTGREVWVQVYDTESLDEAHSLQARLEEEELECVVYEQGRKDVHGNVLKGFGIAVPRTSVSRAQTVIVRTPS